MVVSLSMSTTLVEPTAAICASPQAAVTTSTLRISTFPTTTVTVTSTVSATQSQCITVTISPSAAQSSNQQITDKSDTSCNAIAICIPVAMVIAVVVCVIVFMAVWRLRHKAIYNFVTSNPQMAKIYNDLYGSVILYSWLYKLFVQCIRKLLLSIFSPKFYLRVNLSNLNSAKKEIPGLMHCDENKESRRNKTTAM